MKKLIILLFVVGCSSSGHKKYYKCEHACVKAGETLLNCETKCADNSGAYPKGK